MSFAGEAWQIVSACRAATAVIHMCGVPKTVPLVKVPCPLPKRRGV